MFEDRNPALTADDIRRFAATERTLAKRLLATGCLAVGLLLVAFVW